MNPASMIQGEFSTVTISRSHLCAGDVLVITTGRDSQGRYSIREGSFSSERGARAFCAKEVKWESCIRVQCPALGIDERGDFASFYA